MVSTRNMSKSQLNPQRMQNQQEATSGRQQENLHDFLPTTKTNPPMEDPPPNNDLEALHLVNQ